MKSNSNEIRSPRNGAKLGDKVMLGKEPVVLIKQGGKKDTMSVPEIVEELYGRGTKCIIIPSEYVHACKQMSRTPPWIPGLLLRADGYECEFYKKD